MTGPFEPKAIQVPGLLSDDAFQERLKQFGKDMSAQQKAAPPPNSAVEFADRINSEFLKPGEAAGPVKNPRLQKQDEAIRVRSDILSSLPPDEQTFGSQYLRSLVLGPIMGTFGEGGLADKFLFDPTERQAAADERLRQAEEAEQAVREHANMRAKLRGMTDEQAAAMGLPVAPGGTNRDDLADSIKRDAMQVARAAEETTEAKKATTTPELQPTMPWWLNAVREGYKAAAGTPLSAAKGGIAAWELTGGAIMNGGDLERSDLRAWVDTVEQTLDKMMPGDKARSKDFVTELSRGGGSMAAFMLGGFVGNAIGLPAGAAPAILGALSQGSEGLEDAERFNAVGVQKYLAFLLNAGLGLTEAAPIDRMFMRAEKATGGLVTRMLTNTAASGMEEFIQEFGQAAGHDLVAKWVYDASRELDVAKWARQGAVGLLTGGVAGAAVQILTEAGVTDAQPTGEPVDDAMREEAATTVIDVLQGRFDEMTAQPPVDIALSAEEAADAVLRGDFVEGADEQLAEVAPAEPRGSFIREDDAPDALRSMDVNERFEKSGYLPAVRVRGRTFTAKTHSDAIKSAVRELGDLSEVDENPENYFGYIKVEEATAPQEGVVQGPGGTIPVNEAGKMELRHYSRQALEEIDPSFRGTGPLIGDERARLAGPEAADRSYFGAGRQPGLEEQRALAAELRAAQRLPQRAGEIGKFTYPRHEAERAAFRKHVEQRGYAPEAGLGSFRHVVEADPATIYNALEDPLNLRGQLDADLSRNERVTQFERLVRDAGFKGLYYAESELGQVALMFEKTKPTQVVDERSGLNLRFDPSTVKDVVLDRRDTQPLPGLTTSAGPVPSVVQAARAYAAARGLPVRRQAEYVKVDVDRAKRIAEAYDKMKHAPNNPKVKRAYEAMAEETLAQYQFVKATGLEIEAIEPGQPDPYPEGPKQVLEDLQRGHLWFYPTDQGFGTLTDIRDNPLLAPTDEWIGGRQLVVNDVFRIVHDFFGHGIEGSGFGARGEENAWQSHMRLYSEAALPAVTSETRGQNSWVNYGPFGEQNRANQRETVYADQKTGIMPEWTWREGVADDDSMSDLLARVGDPLEPAKQQELVNKVPGLAKVLPYMTPDEQARVRKANAQKLVDMVEQLPSAEEMAAVAFSGRAKRGWYAKSAQALLDIFGLEDAPRFSGLLAALSPQTSVETNTINALNVWAAWIRMGRPSDAKGATRAIYAGLGGQSSVLPAWTKNAVEALTNPDVNAISLSGPKVSSFMANLNNVVHEVTNDAWMTNYAGVTDKFVKGQWTGEKNIKSLGYMAMSSVVRRAADVATELTGEKWTPAEIQETVWSWAKTLYETAYSRQDQKFSAATAEKRIAGTTAEQVLAAGGLKAEDLSATPDFATLFVTGVYRNILERGGYDLSKLDVGDKQSDGRADRGRDPLSAEGSGFDAGTFERHLQRAAQRLDALSAARQNEARLAGAAEEAQVDDGRNQLPEWVTDDDIDALAMAGTSAARGPYKAEQTRPDQGIATPAGQTGTTENAELSLSKITRNLTKLMDLTLRQGRISMSARDSFGNKQEVMGEYNRRQDVTRVRTMNDLSTIVHEAGHALYFGASDPLKVFIASNDTKLMQVATDLYGGDTNVMPKGTHVAEGFAEFFRVYTLNRRYAERKYPALTSAFDQLLETNDTKLKDGLELIGQQFAAWLQLPSSQMVANMIVSGKQDTGIAAAIGELREAGFQTWFHEVARATVEQSVNRFASFDSLINQTLNIGQRNKGQAVDLKRADDPRVMLRLAQNSGARAQVQLTDGVMGYRSVTSETRGLRDALLLSQGKRADQNLGSIDPVRQKDFAAYLVALRGIDEYRRFDEGKIERPPVAATLGDLKLVVDEMQAKYPEFAEAGKIVHEYAMGLWKKAYDAGLMSQDTYEDNLDRQFYAPLQRDMSDKKSTFGDGPLTGGRKLVKQFRGSDRDIIDPMDILMHKTFALEQIIARNDVLKLLAQLADRAGKAGAMVERIPATQMIGRQYGVREIARQLTKDENLTEADAVDLMTILEASIEDEKTLALFRSEQASTLGENVVFFWENGKLAALQLADGDLGADIVNVVNGLGRENLPLFADLIAATSTAFRSSITLWPDFLVVNFIRDQMSAFILTDVGFKPFWTGLKGVGDELRQRQWAKQYNASMGMMGGMNVAALHNARVNRDISALRKKGYVASVFRERGLLGAIKGMAHVTEMTETGTRLGIFRNAFERAKADGLNDWEASIEASYTATDYMNFGLNGSRMLLFRRTIPFLNAQLQGLYKMMRTLGADEVRQRRGLRFVLRAYFKSTKGLDLSRTEKAAINTGRKAWVKMASLGLISAALHFLFEDDPDYQEAGEYLRTTGWVIPVGDGRLVYIPKPFELAVLANFTERAFEYAGGDSTAKTRFLRGLAMTMTPPTSPPALQSLVEYAANKDFFTGQEIVPSYMQALSPELQFNNYTTALAKEIGEITGWSPMVIDHFMSSLGASAYRDVTNVYNALDPNRPEMDATDAPLTRRFVRDVRRGSASSRDFWAQASTINGTLRTAENSYKRYLEAGNESAANTFLGTLDEDAKAYALLNANFKAEYKRLNPFYRTRQVNTVISAMRRELVSDLGVDDTTVKNSGETIKLSRREKNEIDTALSELARREMRNTLIAMGAPGWRGKKQLRTDTTIDLIGAIDPRMRDELERRIAKAKVYSADVVYEYWPEVKNRLISDRENTFLDDILAIAKATR